MHVIPLPYRPDSAALFEPLADSPWSVFLDSGRPYTAAGRWDVIAAEPRATLVARGGVTRIESGGGVEYSEGDPLRLLREHLGASNRGHPGLPFAGGAIGYLGYELGRRLAAFRGVLAREAGVPEMAMGIYDWALLVDHTERASWLVWDPPDGAARPAMDTLVARFSTPARASPRPAFAATGPVTANLDGPAYAGAVSRIQDYIRAGDCYQVNLALRFSAAIAGDPWLGYQRLRRLNPAPFGAYLNLPFARVLSSSPERFLELRQGRVSTRPIKGTRPRAADPAEDRAQAQALAASAKDRAENLMIVDLLRNDLGKVCRTGSVTVPGLFEVETFAHVHHLVSTISGELAPGKDALDLLRACLPGGSITGAPKRRAMQIIEELEPDPRGVYCGAIGYLSRHGDMDMNIAIRTLVSQDGRIDFWAGGGIVADSTTAAEYQECLDKAAPMLQLLREETASS